MFSLAASFLRINEYVYGRKTVDTVDVIMFCVSLVLAIIQTNVTDMSVYRDVVDAVEQLLRDQGSQ